MSTTRITCHIVFATKNRRPTIINEHKRELYAYIYGIIQNKKCTLIRMNGMADHIHLLVDIHPSVSVSELVKAIKQASSIWLKGNPNFPTFECWGEGYFAVSVGNDGIEACKNYIITQEEHHCKNDFLDELKSISKQYGLDWLPQGNE